MILHRKTLFSAGKAQVNTLLYNEVAVNLGVVYKYVHTTLIYNCVLQAKFKSLLEEQLFHLNNIRQLHDELACKATEGGEEEHVKLQV